MSTKTIYMSKGCPVCIELDKWIAWATATDYDHRKHQDDLQNFSSLHAYRHRDQEKYLVFGKRHIATNGNGDIYAGILITDEADLIDTMHQVASELGVRDAGLMRKWEQDLPAEDLD